MSNRDLSAAQMIAIARPLLDPDQSPKLAALPRVAPYLDDWTMVTDKLRSTQSTDGKSPEEIKLQAESAAADALHDHLIGGILDVIDGVVLLSEPDVSAAFAELKHRLLPAGAMTSRAAYLEEVGTAELVAQRTTAEDRALLARVILPKGTLEQSFDAWLAVARKLGETETRRASLPRAGASRAEVSALRLQWNRIAKVIRAAADTEPSLTDEARHDIFGAYDQEVSRHKPAPVAAVVAPAPKPSPEPRACRPLPKQGPAPPRACQSPPAPPAARSRARTTLRGQPPPRSRAPRTPASWGVSRSQACRTLAEQGRPRSQTP